MMDNTYSIYSNPPRRAPPPPPPPPPAAVGCCYYDTNVLPYNIDGYTNNNRGVVAATTTTAAGNRPTSISSISIMSSPAPPPQYNGRRFDNNMKNEHYYYDNDEYNRYNDYKRQQLYERHPQHSATAAAVAHNRGYHIDVDAAAAAARDTLSNSSYTTQPSQQQQQQQQAFSSHQYNHHPHDNISYHDTGRIGSSAVSYHYDRRQRQAPPTISRPTTFESSSPYREDDHRRPSSNIYIPAGKENTNINHPREHKKQDVYVNGGEPDGETDPARAEEKDDDVEDMTMMVTNFPIGWRTATRSIPSGSVKREYNMTANRPGIPIHIVRHEAIRFFQILMSPEPTYLQSVGSDGGWCVNGFMYRLTRDDDVGVLIQQIDNGNDGDLLMLNVIIKDTKMDRMMTPKITAAVEAWDYAIRQLVNSNAKAQTVRCERNGAFRSYLDQYYFPGIPTSCLPSWVKLSRPPRIVKQEYLTINQLYGDGSGRGYTQPTQASAQVLINPSKDETFNRQGVTCGGDGGGASSSSLSSGVCDKYRVSYDV